MEDRINFVPDEKMQKASEAVREAVAAGVQKSSIHTATGVNRSLISVLANHGAAPISADGLDKILTWHTDWKASREGTAQGAGPAGDYKQTTEIIPTEAFKSALGHCGMYIDNKWLGVIIGTPGTGKTTVARHIQAAYPHVIYVEARTSMRLGDLLDMIAAGAGITLKGTTLRRALQLEAALKGTDWIIIIDEAEYLRKWNNDKLNEIRKLQEHAGIPVILLGTDDLHHVLERADATMLSSRMTEKRMDGANKAEVKRALLEGYNIDPEMAASLAEIAYDTSYGGMRSCQRLLSMCLKLAGGGRMTMEMLEDAKQYKTGLRKG